MSLRADIALQRGTLDLRLDVEVGRGEVVALLGPNGAGKSTVLRAVAGLEPVAQGRIALHDGPGTEVLDDPAAGVLVPAERRPIGVVFQDLLLFAHLSALDNVAFGLRARGVDKSAARRQAVAWLDRMGLGPFAHHRPRQLSGGQAQRVALARALATHPLVLLLDEPLAALDAGTRGDVRRDLRRHLDRFDGMTLLVTHDPVDAYLLADSVVVVEAGKATQAGTVAEVTAQPRSQYVADLVGTNLVRGHLRGRVLTTASGAVVTTTTTEEGPAFATIRPNAISLHPEPPRTSARNVWSCVVADVGHVGNRVHLGLEGPLPLVAEITPAALAALGLRPGDRVWASVKATEVDAYVT